MKIKISGGNIIAYYLLDPDKQPINPAGISFMTINQDFIVNIS
jgi:hypothetical protein